MRSPRSGEKSVVGWRVHYDVGTFDSLEGDPHEAPPEGFVCAVGYDERGERYIMHGWVVVP